jgi:predicted DNA binding CopG/RHH family protein
MMAKKTRPSGTKKTADKHAFFDIEEEALIASLKRGEWQPAKNAKAIKAKLKQAAEDHLRKKERINIRISRADLMDMKINAAREGIPYQTLIASLIHKYNQQMRAKD